jgi:hypothetical protein
MKNHLLIILLLLTGISLQIHGQTHQKVYTYANIDPSATKLLRYLKETVRVGLKKLAYWRGHAGVGRMKLCNEKSDFYCFSTPPVSFAVPKLGLKIGLSWRQDNCSYKVTDETMLRFFGEEINVFVISSKDQKGRGSFYFYSLVKGLIGMSFKPTGKIAEIYWLEDKVGFPF